MSAQREHQLAAGLLEVLTSEEVASVLRRSRSWVLANAAALGASRIGGSWIFTKEGLNRALLRSRSMEIRQKDQRTTDKPVLRKQERSPRLGKRAAETIREGLNRHGVGRAGSQVPGPLSTPVHAGDLQAQEERDRSALGGS